MASIAHFAGTLTRRRVSESKESRNQDEGCRLDNLWSPQHNQFAWSENAENGHNGDPGWLTQVEREIISDLEATCLQSQIEIDNNQ